MSAQTEFMNKTQLNGESTVEQQTIKIGGMTCDGCVQSVKRVLLNMPGVDVIDVSLALNQAIVKFDPQRIDIARITQSIENAGYEARG